MKRLLFGNKFNTFFFLFGIIHWIMFSSEFNRIHKQSPAVEIWFFFLIVVSSIYTVAFFTHVSSMIRPLNTKTFKMPTMFYFYFVSSSENADENMKPKWNHRWFGLITKFQFSMWFMQSELSIWFENTIIYFTNRLLYVMMTWTNLISSICYLILEIFMESKLVILFCFVYRYTIRCKTRFPRNI